MKSQEINKNEVRVFTDWQKDLCIVTKLGKFDYSEMNGSYIKFKDIPKGIEFLIDGYNQYVRTNKFLKLKELELIKND
jgi:hypothetical protein